MIEIPKRPADFPIETGAQGPGFQCKACGAGIAIGGNPATLPPTFELKCPACQQIRMYLSEEIQILTAQLKS